MDARCSIFIIGFLYFSAHLCRGLPSDLAESADRIINGTETDIEEVPYMLQFMIDDKYVCGAGIISNTWAVTAAHCVWPAQITGSEITVRSESSLLYEGGAVHRVIKALVHEKYNTGDNDYDIALLEVTPPFTFGDRTEAVGLPPVGVQEISKELGLVCGWGYYKKNPYTNDFEPELSDKLQCIQLPLIKKSQCILNYLGYILTPRMECYGFENGEGDSCKGDSGSPLVNENNILLGLTSWGRGCAEKHSPGVYTNVTDLRMWIKDKIGI